MIWAVGGGITLLACFAFAELGAMFPEAGGQYVYLREAYGKLPAFLYGWMIFTVSAPGTIAALAVGFAEYLGALWPALAAHARVVHLGRLTLTRGDLVALAAIALLTATNIFGVRRGAVVQNIATWMKFAAATRSSPSAPPLGMDRGQTFADQSRADKAHWSLPSGWP